ncbi:hypothetical protein ACH42_07870 [Endozoicomonas sp. (ex Bugula neritina AB1)]|nr:hypothetical protein ACH42_07870 [Endozoicomonas sp. (ex Bugula neritina AB1)]
MQGLQSFLKNQLCLIVVTLCMFGAPVHSSEAVLITENTEELNLAVLSDYYEDTEGTLSLNELDSPEFQSRFKPVPNDVFNMGITRSVVWLRFDLRYRSSLGDELGTWLIQIGYPSLDLITLYVQDPDEGFIIVHSGDKYPYGIRSISHPTFLFPVDIRSGETARFYIRVETSGSMQIPLKLWSPLAYLERSSLEGVLTGAVLGILLVLLIYNCVQFIAIRESCYLFYVAYVSSFLLYLLSINGIGMALVWRDYPIINSAAPFFMSMMGVTGVIFSRYYLRLGESIQWLDWMYILMIMLGFLVMPISLLVQYGIAARLVMFQVLLSLPVLIITGGWFWVMQKNRAAQWFAIAFMLLLMGIGVHIMVLLGLIANTSVTSNAVIIGQALQATLLSLGLASRTRMLRMEKIKEEQLARRKIESTKHQLQESNRLKGAFLQAISKELSSPATQVAESLDDLVDGGSLESHKALLEAARHSSREINTVVSHLLTLTEFQSATVTVAQTPFHLRKQLEITVDRYRAKALVKRLPLVIDIDESVPYVLYGDSEKLMQALSYLIDNAIKFTDQGQVTVRAFAEPNEQGESLLSLQVSDTGKGIPPDRQEAVFEAFHQVEEDHSGDALGLGLAVCQHLVNILGGEVGYHPESSSGACFQIDVICQQSLS